MKPRLEGWKVPQQLVEGQNGAGGSWDHLLAAGRLWNRVEIVGSKGGRMGREEVRAVLP